MGLLTDFVSDEIELIPIGEATTVNVEQNDLNGKKNVV